METLPHLGILTLFLRAPCNAKRQDGCLSGALQGGTPTRGQSGFAMKGRSRRYQLQQNCSDALRGDCPGELTDGRSRSKKACDTN